MRARLNWLLCMLLYPGISGAAITTVTFDDAALGGPQVGDGANFLDQGFRFSPCHNYGIVDSSNPGIWSGFGPAAGFNDSQFFVFQAGNGGGNPEYLGFMPGCGYPRATTGSSLYIDNGGRLFSVLSLYGALYNGVGLTSSKGGSAYITAFPAQTWTLSGPEWTDVSWINFAFGLDQPVGFDQITFQTVPEPGTLAQFGAGLSVLAAWAARRRFQRPRSVRR
jgi:hypothetical protein